MVLAVAKASSAAGARLQVSSQKQALEHVHHTTGGVLSTTPWTKGNRHSQALSMCSVALRTKHSGDRTVLRSTADFSGDT